MAYISFQPSDYFNTKLYTGTGSSNAITGVGFQPDFTWIKNRDAADFNVLTDAVRGATKYWQSNSDAAEVTDTETLKSFDSDGFTVGTTAQVNTNTEDYVSWNWKAGTTTGIAGSPSITPSSYSFNATSGFSVIAYTGNGVAGATLPHGLGVAPKFIIVKSTLVDEPLVYTSTSGATKYQALNTTMAASTSTTAWNDTAPTATLFSLGSGADVNANTEVYTAYCFTDVQGYSKFGNWTGSGNIDGPFIYTGFRPAWVVIKRYDSGSPLSDWHMYDDKRLGYNVSNRQLAANANSTEQTDVVLDLLSNGFKLRTTNTYAGNGSGQNILYMAFAEFPLVSSNDIPGTAR